MLVPKTSYLSVYLTNFTRRLLQVINIEFFSTHYFTCCSEGAQGAIGMFVFKNTKQGFSFVSLPSQSGTSVYFILFK